jgi:hypothetical protein
MPPSSYAQGLKHACMRGLRVLLQTNLAEEEKKKHTQRIEKSNIDKLFLKLATIDEKHFSVLHRNFWDTRRPVY